MCCNIQSQSWHRLKNESLALHYTDYCLLYPTEQPDKQTVHVQTINTQTKPTQFLLLDATWQESRKMLNQSKWLNALPKYAITQAPSHYQLRRNQTEQGLSTIETMAQCLFEQKQSQQGQELLDFFNTFQQAYLSARQAGLLS